MFWYAAGSLSGIDIVWPAEGVATALGLVALLAAAAVSLLALRGARGHDRAELKTHPRRRAVSYESQRAAA